MRTIRACLLTTIAALVLPVAATGAAAIKNASISPARFCPAEGDTVQVTYSLTSPASVRIRVYSPDDIAVRTIANWEARTAGKLTASWDGKDDRGVVVPDEAYYLTIEAKDSRGAIYTYDPMRESGGDELEMTDLRHDASTGEMIFSLKRSSRVMVRAGLTDGPLMRTPIDWLPFDKGVHRVLWDGKDESRTTDIGSRSDLKLYGIGYALPDCTVVATGNKSLEYKDYLSALPKTAYRKAYITPIVRKIAISPFWGRPPRYNRAIRFALSRPEILDGKLKATITIAPDDIALLRGVAYEVIAYVDKTLLLDDERGHSPYTLSLDLGKISVGRHQLVVNVASVTDRVGTQSVDISVEDTPR